MAEEIMRGIFLVCWLSYMRIRNERIRMEKSPLLGGLENRGTMIFRALFSFGLHAAAWLYILFSIGAAAIEIPYELRLIGAALALGGAVLLHRAHKALGRQWSPHLEVRTAHKLVSTGPYAFVAHPMYWASGAFLIGQSLISANLLFAALSAAMILFLILRVPKEEQMMKDAFGIEYEVYRKGVL